MEQNEDKIIRVNIENQMQSAYIDYSMSVIVARALPDVRDGLKPVHRRVLFGMNELGMMSNRPYKKSARIVGEVLGKYHPHGDSSVYDAMVRMAQPWSMRYMLIDGQGNFGSIDGDSPAAMRYTEARLRKIAEDALEDIDKNTVDFQANFDDTLEEPTVLPTRIPLLLVNGTSGIAVGMATNMAPHNIGEVIDGCIAYIDAHGEITVEELMQYIKAPDFPTGCTIYGMDGVREGYETGRGRVIMRGDATIEEDNHGRQHIIVSSVPYMVNKAEMIKRTAELVNDKKLEGISDIRDESDRGGLRIVYDIKRDAMADVVLNKLYKHTALQSTFGINNIALVHGRPQTLNLRDLIKYFIEHRHDVVVRRTQFELEKAEKRAHIVEGLLKAIDIIDEIVALIRASKSPDEAKTQMMERYEFTDEQATAILAMRLSTLSGLRHQELRDEMAELLKLIEHLHEVLEKEELRMGIIRNELLEVREKYSDERRSRIEYSSADFNIEDTISNEDMIVTISHMGYIKRTPLREYRVQARGGRGSRGSEVRTDDFVEHLFTAKAHNYMLLFTAKGKCFWMRVFEIPEGTKVSKGRAIQNLINIEPNDKVMAFINVLSIKDQEYIDNNYILMCTKKGILKKTSLEAYSRPRQNGINAITIREEDELLQACLTNGKNVVLLANKGGRAIRFPEHKVRGMGRTASGVRGMTLDVGKNDEVIGMICLEKEDDVLVVSENGYGKRSAVEDYRETNRGGKGVKTINITDKTGDLIAIKNVTDEDDLMIINRSGVIIRTKVASLRVMGRATQGVRLINLKDDDIIAAVCKVPSEDEEEIMEENGTENVADNVTDNVADVEI
ncbi:MAG: DNA gyrase subunit A [Bacteroidales bacterium]|nr:DNA gyrase subunit A [Bacteroidales bacterium]